MELILNRLRGMHILFMVMPWLSGKLLYAIYIGSMVTLVMFHTNNIHDEATIVLSMFYGTIASMLFLMNERVGWNRWVCELSDYNVPREMSIFYPTNDHLYVSEIRVIKSLTNYIVSEERDRKTHSEISLMLCGVIWWAPLFLFLVLIGLITISSASVSVLILAIGYPTSCHLARVTSKYSIGLKLNGIERQELIYGTMQFISLTLVILLQNMNNTYIG